MSRSSAPKPAGAFPSSAVLLAVLALWDLRTELQLLRDHFTITSLAAAAWNHPLAVVVLVMLPGFMRRQRLS